MSSKLLLLFLVFCILEVDISVIFAEGDIRDLEYTEKPNSPSAAEFLKFGNYQMDYSTGVPNIEIPIYEINMGGVSVPISLKYHASGIKVQEIPSCVGLGWQLSAGGCISIDVRGIKDKQVPLYACSKNELYQLTDTQLRSLVALDSDTESDIYHYSFPGHSGSFRFSEPDRTIRTMPYDPIKIEKLSHDVLRFTIYDEEGNQFFFEKPEYTAIMDVNSQSACYLTKIKPANCMDSIMFNYNSGSQNLFYTWHSNYAIPAFLYYNGYTPVYGLQTIAYPVDTRTDVMLLESIEWQNNKVKCQYVDRDDAQVNMFCWKKLTSLFIENACGDTIHRTTLAHDYLEETGSPLTKRLVLKGANINGDIYSFEYDETHKLPKYTNTNPLYSKCNEDFWGYYNGGTQLSDNRCWFPQEFTEQSDYLAYRLNNTQICPKRMPVENYCKTASLIRITYPTGGFTVFDYESNYIREDSIWGGLRLKSYSSYQKDSTLTYRKSYRYESAITSEYILDTVTMMIDKNIYFKDKPHNLCPDFYDDPNSVLYQRREYNGSPYRPITDGGSPLHYLKVTEYDGTETDYVRKTEFEYQRTYFDISYFIDNYDHDMDKIYLWDPEYNYYRGNPMFPLISKRIFEKGVNGSDILVYQETNEYECDTIGKYQAGIRIRPLLIHEGNLSSPWDWVDLFAIQHEFSVSDVFMLSSFNHLTRRTIVQDGITKTSEYYYDTQQRTLKPVRIVESQSDGSTLETEYTYPFQDPLYTGMNGKNIHTPIRETTYRRLGNQLEQVKVKAISYVQLNGQWFPSTISVGLDGNPETRVQYLYKSDGRIASIVKDGKYYQNYVYGYNGKLPVAIIETDGSLDISDITETGYTSLKAILAQLRSNYEQQGCLVSTYIYKPLVGLVWEQDNNRIVKQYTYDERGRLTSIIDSDDSVESRMEYNYRP